jgi:hypothetical protein
MGYLDNTTVTVDAILTNKGRQVLAAGGQLNITKFALADDEIDYTLWNPSHTLGTNYYGAVIEDMPIVEANPDETQMMRYKLVTLPRNVSGIPVIVVNPTSISFLTRRSEQIISPTTANVDGGNSTLGYTAILADSSVATLEVAPGGAITGAGFQAITNNINALASGLSTATGVTNFLDDEVTGTLSGGTSITRVGKSFILKPQRTLTPKVTLLTIIANETGGFKSISVSVAPNFEADIDERTAG